VEGSIAHVREHPMFQGEGRRAVGLKLGPLWVGLQSDEGLVAPRRPSRRLAMSK